MAALVMVAGVGCSSGGSSSSGPPAAGASRPAASPAPGRSTACPASYRAPDPKRPHVTLTFDVAADHTTVTGTEHVAFTPDRPVTEAVFRLLPNGVEGGRTAGSLRVTRTQTAIGSEQSGLTPAPPRFSSAGGRPGTQGTVMRIPLRRSTQVGERVAVGIDFVLTLPPPAIDRYGHQGSVAWWGSGHPLLAWVDGRGWSTEAVGPVGGETAASEAAVTDVTVTAPAADTVLVSGATPASSVVASATGGRRWHAHGETLRDVAVMVAPFSLASATVGGVRITAGVAPGLSGVTAATVLAVARAVVARHVARYGPFPYPALVVGALPGIGGAGVEYPGAVMVGQQVSNLVLVHEIAHEWFYGLVGDDQGAHPWLDEAFATYAEALVDHDEAAYLPALNASMRVDTPTRAFGAGNSGENAYNQIVYGKGAAALLTARTAAGPAAFDQAIRCYVAANAWRVAEPADLARALAGLPKAVAVLRRAGAIS